MIAGLTRSAALAVVLTVGAALADPANAMPVNGTLMAGTNPVVQVGLICTKVCLLPKPTQGGMVCLKYGTRCSTTSGPGRLSPAPARTTPR